MRTEKNPVSERLFCSEYQIEDQSRKSDIYCNISLEVSNRQMFQVFPAASVKMAALWVTAPCSLTEDCPDGWGSRHIWKVGQLLRNYTAQYPRRLSFSNGRLFYKLPQLNYISQDINLCGFLMTLSVSYIYTYIWYMCMWFIYWNDGMMKERWNAKMWKEAVVA
jgi:hypothetical protein